MSDSPPQSLSPPRGNSNREESYPDKQSLHLHAITDERFDNLPLQPTSLVGRGRELVAVRKLLACPDIRLVTLTGAPGIGKTRLALAAAADLLNDFTHGACFVDLAPITDPSLVVATIAQSVGARDLPGQLLLEGLRRALRARQLLLVLDSFEHVLPAVREVAALLEACPELRVLVASRAALNSRWEHLFPVPPLPLPDLERLPAAGALVEYPSVELFVTRARAVRPDFRLNAHNAAAVAEICVRLDGLPLAIELAAARVNVLLPQSIVRHLQRRLDLLTWRAEDAPCRHRSLREAIDWSYDLLPPHEQILFRRLGVFVGGCSLEAAEAVFKGDGCTPYTSPFNLSAQSSALGPQSSVLEGLASLVAKSLLRQEEQPDGQPRFRMLETVREYALERLEVAGQDEAEATRRRHAEYFLALAEQAEWLWGREQAAWSARLERELDNLRAAMAWTLSQTGDREMALQFAGALSGHFWDCLGHLSEGRSWLSALLAATPSRQPARVVALNTLGYLAFVQGDMPAALPLLDEALALARELDDTLGLALSLGVRGAAAYVCGEQDRAMALLEEGITISQANADKLGECLGFFWLALLHWSRGEYGQAIALQEENLALCREREDSWGTSHALFILGKWTWQRGDYQRATALLRESLVLRRDQRDRSGFAACLDELACVAARQGLWGRAARLFGAGEALRESVGVIVVSAWQSDPTEALATARAGLGEERLAAAWASGRAMTLDEAIACALAATERTSTAQFQQSPSSGQLSFLTEREREVAALIAQGSTNRQIAAVLVVSRRTAETHVANVLSKLGFTSRAQAAAWLVGRGVLTPPGQPS